jgi:hypothetical protein
LAALNYVRLLRPESDAHHDLVAIRDALTAIIALPAPIREVVAPRATPNGEDPRPPAFPAARTPSRSSRRKLIGEWKRPTPEEVRASEGRLLDAMRAAPNAGVAELARRGAHIWPPASWPPNGARSLRRSEGAPNENAHYLSVDREIDYAGAGRAHAFVSIVVERCPLIGLVHAGSHACRQTTGKAAFGPLISSLRGNPGKFMPERERRPLHSDRRQLRAESSFAPALRAPRAGV